jgi:hypothetical protein
MVDTQGRVALGQWLKGSGDARWDDSVRRAVAATAEIGRRPPAGFPNQFVVRFDVQALTEEPIE